MKAANPIRPIFTQIASILLTQKEAPSRCLSAISFDSATARKTYPESLALFHVFHSPSAAAIIFVSPAKE